jgi:type IV secretory pathway TrbD component
VVEVLVSDVLLNLLWGLAAFGVLLFAVALSVILLTNSYDKEVARVVARIKEDNSS